MAARGNKNKDHRIPVTDIAHWNKELAFGGIVIAEVFSSWFGPCEALTPTVQQLMLDIDDAPNKMKWLLVNVAKLEEQQLKQRQEEEKKQKENEIAQRRKAEGEGKSDEKDTPASHTSVGSDASAVSIPLLEKYAGYEHPRPLWVFIQDKKVLGEMRSANPPRLRTVLTKYMAGETVEPEVLPEPVLPKEFQAKAAVVATPVEEAEAHGDSEEAEQEDLEDVDVSNPAAKAAEAENQEAAAKPSEEEAKGAEPAGEAAPAPAAEENPAPVSESKADEAESAAPEEKQPAAEEAAPAPAEPEKEKTPSEAPAGEAKEPGSKRGTATQAVLTKMGSQLSKGTNSRRSTLNASESKSNKKP